MESSVTSVKAQTVGWKKEETGRTPSTGRTLFRAKKMMTK